MKVVGLDHRQYSWNLSGSVPLNSERQGSNLHARCRNLLYKLFPCTRILEELTIPGTRMVLDFFLPQEKIAVEVQGQQHYELNTFYHKNRLDFINQLSRDKQKREFCERNNIRLIELPYNESDEEWSIRLNE